MNIPAEFLGFTNEAAVILRGSRIMYANRAAENFFSRSCAGCSVKELFGAELASVQSGSYVASAVIMGKSCIVRSSMLEGVQMLMFSEAENTTSALNDSFLTTINSTLMNMSVSINTGLSVAQELGNEPMRSCVEHFSRDYNRLKRLASNVSFAGKFLNRTLPFYPVYGDLAEFCRSYIAVAERLCPEISFRVNVPEVLYVDYDRPLLTAAVSNLISNCILHAYGATMVSLTLIDAPNSVMISVTDNGSGIDPQVMPTVFSRYRSISGLGSCSGAGFGLTVVRAAAEMHEGTLLLESREKLGTTVRFSVSKSAQRKNSLFGAGRLNEETVIDDIYIGLADVLPGNPLT